MDRLRSNQNSEKDRNYSYGRLIRQFPSGSVIIRDDTKNVELYAQAESLDRCRGYLYEGVPLSYQVVYNTGTGKHCAIDVAVRNTQNRTKSQPHQTKQQSLPAKPRPPLKNLPTKPNQTNPKSQSRGSGGKTLGKVRICDSIDRTALNLVLSSPEMLPEKFRRALLPGTASVTDSRMVVLEGNVDSPHKLEMFFKKSAVPGWIDWLSGKSGWTMAEKKPDKSRFVPYHRSLHMLYEKELRNLRKKYKSGSSMRSHLDIIYYKFPVSLRVTTELLWTRVSDGGSLQDAVAKLRPFLEVLRFCSRNRESNWKKEVPWLEHLSCSERQRRLRNISEIVYRLLRSSESGPDAPVHWAAHPPLNDYPLAVVSNETMTELVVSLANIMGNLFLTSFNKPLQTLADVDAFLSRDGSETSVDNLIDEFGRLARTY